MVHHDIYETIRNYESAIIDSDESEFKESYKSGFDYYVERCTEQLFAKYLINDISLPAHSSDGKKSCGNWQFKGCLNHESHVDSCVHCMKVEQHCNSRGCKVCFVAAITREAKSIADRMVGFVDLKSNRKIYLKDNRSRLLLHTVISPPQCIDKENHFDGCSCYLETFKTKEGRKEMKDKHNQLTKLLDIDGGTTITHPYRFNDDKTKAYLSPHYHNILTGWIDGNLVSKINKGEWKKKSKGKGCVYDYRKFKGWTVVVIRSIRSYKDCFGLARYMLSHAAVFEREIGKRSTEHSVSYFGECQNRMFKTPRVLAKSVDGYDQIDELVSPSKAEYEVQIQKVYDSKKKKFVQKRVRYQIGSIPLQKVSYSYSEMDSELEDSIKDVTREDFEYSKEQFTDMKKALRDYIKPSLNREIIPVDNPAESQSASFEPFRFLQMRLDYGRSEHSMVLSEYVCIILDPNETELCPECSVKMKTLVPPDDWSDENECLFAETFQSMTKGEVLKLDSSMGLENFDRFNMSPEGMVYFTEKGLLQHESGIYSTPSCIDKLNPTLYRNIVDNVRLQELKYRFKIDHGVPPTKEQLDSMKNPVKLIQVNTKSRKLSDF